MSVFSVDKTVCNCAERYEYPVQRLQVVAACRSGILQIALKSDECVERGPWSHQINHQPLAPREFTESNSEERSRLWKDFGTSHFCSEAGYGPGDEMQLADAAFHSHLSADGHTVISQSDVVLDSNRINGPRPPARLWMCCASYLGPVAPNHPGHICTLPTRRTHTQSIKMACIASMNVAARVAAPKVSGNARHDASRVLGEPFADKGDWFFSLIWTISSRALHTGR